MKGRRAPELLEGARYGGHREDSMRFRTLMILAMVAGLALASGTHAKRGHEGGGPPGHAGGNGQGKGHKGIGSASAIVFQKSQRATFYE